jgi:AraC-like DNA-binding protein
VIRAIAALAVSVPARRQPTERQIAESLNIDPAHLGRVIHLETGITFRQWRAALHLRGGLPHLIDSNEQIKQIACSFLGFDHQSQFDREFRQIFGLTPTEFRRLAQTLPR